MYIDKVDDIVTKSDNTCSSTIKIKPVDVKSSTYIDLDKINKENLRFKVGGHVRMSKYKNIFANGYVQDWSD